MVRDVLDPDVEAGLRAWLADGAPTPAFATAPTGSGLTTLVAKLVRDLRFEPVWASPTDEHLEDRLADAGGSRFAPNGRAKIVVIDDFDHSADKRAVAIVTAYVPRAKVKVLCLGHPARSVKASSFAAKWARFDFPRVADSVVADLLVEAGADAETARRIAAGCRGDVRAALAALDLARRTEVETPVTFKDPADDALDSVEKVLGRAPTSVADLLRTYDADVAIVPAGVFENYLACLAKGDLGVALRTADLFSLADVVDATIRAGQSWDLRDVHGALSTAGPGLELRRRRGTAAVKVEKFGSIWSKEHNGRAKAKNAMAIQLDRAEHGLPRMDVCAMAFQRAMIADAVSYGADADVAAACEPLCEKSVLYMMRMGVKTGAGYKHARVKRVLKR